MAKNIPEYPSDRTWFAGRRVLVVGLARSGLAAIRLLKRLDAQPEAVDSKPRAQLEKTFDTYGQPGCPCFFGVDPIPLLARADAVVISPAVPAESQLVATAQAQGLPVIGELELGYLAAAQRIVAVSGTNGKTTTVTLLGQMLAEAGKHTAVCGNIGYPLSAAVLEAPEDAYLVTEVSSFQMETARAWHAPVAMLLNITPDHLNRHHTMDAYAGLKYRLFLNQTREDTAVLNRDDALCRSARGHTSARVFWFSGADAVDDGAYATGGDILVARGGRAVRVCGVDELLIPGRHNVMNALAACAAAAALGLPPAAIAAALRAFPGVEHRIEFVDVVDGIRYLNDSKGTNPDATMRAVEAMSRPTVIILGGQEKDTPFEEMAAFIKASGLIRHAVVMGETADSIARCLRAAGFARITRADSLEDAVLAARDFSTAGGAVLLSPACASFDMFEDYEERGREFKRIVRALDGVRSPR